MTAAPRAAVAAALALLEQIATSGERRLLLLEGDRGWGLAAAAAIAETLATAAATWIMDDPPPGLPGVLAMAKAAGLLGGECGLLIIDAHAGLDADALGAATGTLRGDGLLLLLCPPLATWPELPDPQAARIAVHGFGPADVGRRFVRRLARLLAGSSAVHRCREADSLSSQLQIAPTKSATLGAICNRDPQPPGPPSPLQAAPNQRRRQPCCGSDQESRRQTCSDVARRDCKSLPRPATTDQQSAIEAIEHLARGRARRPLVLTADRGRGKSAALGIAAARLLAEGARQIVVTAPRRSAAAALFAHAGPHGSLRFVPPDALLRERPDADLLLVDEAAGIPAPLLAGLLDHYGRIAFATTVHGYEGTGRGFEVRFRALLDQRTPGWRELRLLQPIRWAAGDPLERLIDRALLLDAEPAADAMLDALSAAELDPGALRIERLDRDRLAADEALLRQVFGLLVLGHYQTRPADLRMLLDAPNLDCFVARVGRGEHSEVRPGVEWAGDVDADFDFDGDAGGTVVVGTALVAREGGLGEELLGPIFDGLRRPRGHLLPQTLSAHAGLFDAPRLGFARIVRIAVHPAAQGRGIGRRLVGAIAEQAAADGLDLVGASFGATAGLLAFWRRCGLEPVQLGTHRNAASGAHAACVLRALSRAGAGLHDLARQRLLPRLAVLLSGPLRDLEPAVAALLIAAAPTVEPALDAVQRLELAAFADADRSLEAALPALHRLVLRQLPSALAAGRLDARQAAAVISCVLQARDPAAAAPRLGLSGRAALIRLLRDACVRLSPAQC